MDAADVLWKHVVDDWQDDKRHQAFLAFCVENGSLDDAARRYRAVAEASEDALVESPPSGESGYRALPSRRDDAKKRLGAVAILAMSALDNHRTPPSAGRYALYFKIFAGAFLVLSLIGLAWAFTVGK